MDQNTTIWIKKEEADEVTDEPGFAFLEDPLNIEDPCLCVKQELKLHVEGSEQKFLQDPLNIVEPGHHIKEDPELKLDVDGSEHTFLQDPLSFEEPGHHIKQETKMKLDVDDSEHNFLQDPLNIDELGHHIKQDPDLKRNVDGFDHHVVASTSYASNSTRLIQNTEESCDFSFEETVDEGVVHSELEMRADESIHFSMYGVGGEGQREEEEVEEEGLKCSLQQNKCLRFGCSICLQSFPSKYSLIMHVFVHINGVQPPTYVCKSCGEVFPSQISMCKHLSMSKVEQSLAACNNEKFDCSEGHKSIFLEGDGEDNAMVEPQNRYSSKEPCKSSKKSFNIICKSHCVIKDAEIPHSSDYYKTLLTTNKVNDRSIVSPVNRRHKCNVCEKSCSSLADLKRHLLIHTGEKPYKCDICDKSFTRKSFVKRHLVIHSERRLYKCDVCSKYLVSMHGFKNHALRHTEGRPP